LASTLTDDELKIFNTVLADNAHIAKSDEQKQAIRQIYDAPNGPVCSETVHGELAAYLALLHIAGPMAQGAFYPDSKLTTSPPGTRPHHICANICAARQPDCLPAASNRFSVGDVTDTKANGK